MSKVRFLITGGAGFIGANLAAALAATGERVRVFDNLSSGSWSLLEHLCPRMGHMELMRGDIRDAEALGRAMEGVEVIFHLAADGSVQKSVDNPLEADSNNLHGTVAVLERARHAGVRRLIFASSSAVYGDEPEQPKREGMAVRPLSPYAVSKAACEQYLRVFSALYGLDTMSLRYFNVFGPGQLPWGAYAAAIPRFASAVLEGRPVTVHGDGEQTRDFCYIDNVIEANLAAASAARGFQGEALNIATGVGVSVNRLLAALEARLQRPVSLHHEAPRPGEIRHSRADITLARELLGYQPRVSWEAGLAPTLAFLREALANPERHGGAPSLPPEVVPSPAPR
jgi:UDP-glucose 4-epimerase